MKNDNFVVTLSVGATGERVEFEWDEAKNVANQRKHGISFESAVRALLDPDAIFELDGYELHEERWRVIGSTDRTAVLLVVYTDRGSDEIEVARLISARQADRRERRRYEQNKMG